MVILRNINANKILPLSTLLILLFLVHIAIVVVTTIFLTFQLLSLKYKQVVVNLGVNKF